MKDTQIIACAAFILAGLAFTYWELKKNQQLLQTLLINVRELRIDTYPKNIQNSMPNSNSNHHSPLQPTSANNAIPIHHPDIQQNSSTQLNSHIVQEQQNNEDIDVLEHEIQRYQSELNKLNEEIDDQNSIDESTMSDNIDYSDIVQKVNNNIESKMFTQDNDELVSNDEEQIIEHLESDNEIINENNETSSAVTTSEHLDNREENISVSETEISNNNNIELESNPVSEILEITKDLIELYNDKYTAKQLQNLCRENDLKVKGTKPELISRLLKNNKLEQVNNTSNISM